MKATTRAQAHQERLALRQGNRDARRPHLEGVDGPLLRLGRFLANVEPDPEQPPRWEPTGEELLLPARKAIAQVYAFLARRGAGKTYAAGVLVEQMIDAGAQVVVIDPVGTWWGLRHAGDAPDAAGINIPIIGGLHGDAPIQEDQGRALAEYVVSRRRSVVLDVSMMRKGARKRFCADFLEALFELKKSQRSPLHLVLEEAATVCPERVMKGDERLAGAAEDVVRRGRNFGIGATLIDQRPQSVDKDDLNQAEVLFTLQISGPQERTAIEKWAQSKGTTDSSGWLDELPDLPIGQAWVWSPQWLRFRERVEIAKRRTFDASATPELDDERYEPANMPELDEGGLAELREDLADAFKRDEEANPAKLKKRIHQLEKRVLELETQQPPPVAAISPELLDGLRVVEQASRTALAGLDGLSGAIGILKGGTNRLANILQLLEEAPMLARGSIFTASPAPKPGTQIERDGKRYVYQPAQMEIPSHVSPGPDGTIKIEPVGDLGRGQVRILLVLWQVKEKLTKRDLGVLSCYHHDGGTFVRYLGELAGAGLIDSKRGREDVWLTEKARGIFLGREELHRHPGFTTDQVIAGHLAALGAGQGKILRTLAKCHPDSMDRKALGAMTGYEPNGGTFVRYVGELVGRGLIERVGDGELRARDALFTFGPWSGA